MNINFIIVALENFAPLSLQEKWDNSGLQIGLPPEAEGTCTGVLLCVDVTPEIVAEAVSRGCNLVVSHHPLIFKGLKSLTGSNVAERAAAAAIRAGVAVYSTHTPLDSTRGGISYEMADRLGATVTGCLVPADSTDLDISVMCPRNCADDVRLILLDGDAPATISTQQERSALEVTEDKQSGIPRVDITHSPLCRVEARVAADRLSNVREALASMPCAAELSISIQPVHGRSAQIGLGVVARFEPEISMEELGIRLKERFGCPHPRMTAYNPDAKVGMIALCGGSGGEFIPRATARGAQAYITADVRYHDFAEYASGSMAVFDIGHFESESCAKDIICRVIKNNFPNFAVHYSELETNPVKYL